MFDYFKKRALKSALPACISTVLLGGLLLFLTAPVLYDSILNKTQESAHSPFFLLAASIICLTGLVFFLWGLWLFIKTASGKSLKSLRNTIAGEGCSETTAESDFQAAVPITEDGGVRVGRLFTYYMSGSVPKALPNNKMMWAYQTITTHRSHGIKTSTSCRVVIYLYGVKKAVDLDLPSQAAPQMLERLQNSFPWVIVGFSDDLKRLFEKDRKKFLALRYNTVEHRAVETAPAEADGSENPDDGGKQ